MLNSACYKIGCQNARHAEVEGAFVFFPQLCSALCAQGYTVIAACRSESVGLLKLAVDKDGNKQAGVEIISGMLQLRCCLNTD